MNITHLLDRVRNLLFSPKTEWPRIAEEPATAATLYLNYILVLAAVPAVFGFIKGSLIGSGIPFLGMVRVNPFSGFAQMLAQYGLTLGLVYLLALIVDALAPSFGAQKNPVQALKTVAYAYTASWVAGLGLLLPWLGLLITIGGAVYSLVLLYLGLPHTMRAPPQRRDGYFTVIVALGFVLGWAVHWVVPVVGGGAAFVAGAPGILSSGTTVEFDSDSPLGKLNAMAEKVEAASKRLETAQRSGDSQAQAEAAGAVLGAVLSGGDSVQALDGERLKSFIPDTLSGLPRRSIQTERSGALGMQVSTAKARYSDNQDSHLELEITDTGSIKGLVALATWASLEHERSTDTGYEKTYRANGRLVHEQWDNSRHYGEYTVVLAERFAVKVSGSAASIDLLKAAVESIPLSRLEALRNEGVKRG